MDALVPEGILVAFLAWAAASDIRSRRIPNVCTSAGTVLLALALLLAPRTSLDSAALAALLFGFLAGLSLARPSAIGMGDAKLIGMITLGIGPLVLSALALGLGSALAEALVRNRGRMTARARKGTIALGPHLALGCAVVLAMVG